MRTREKRIENLTRVFFFIHLFVVCHPRRDEYKRQGRIAEIKTVFFLCFFFVFSFLFFFFKYNIIKRLYHTHYHCSRNAHAAPASQKKNKKKQQKIRETPYGARVFAWAAAPSAAELSQRGWRGLVFLVCLFFVLFFSTEKILESEWQSDGRASDVARPTEITETRTRRAATGAERRILLSLA